MNRQIVRELLRLFEGKLIPNSKGSFTQIRVSEQYPKVIQDKRKQLIPYLVKAKRDGKMAHLSYDTHIYTHIYIYIYIYIYTHTHIYIHTYIYTHIHTYIYIYIYIHIYIHIHIHTYTHTHIYIHTHTHTHTYMLIKRTYIHVLQNR